LKGKKKGGKKGKGRNKGQHDVCVGSSARVPIPSFPSSLAEKREEKGGEGGKIRISTTSCSELILALSHLHQKRKG